jgi:HD superfamily phosphohydrolase
LPREELAALSLPDQFCLLAAGLLHDIGHSAWSHVGEEFAKFRQSHISHDMLSVRLVAGDLLGSEFSIPDGYFSRWSSCPRVASVLKDEEKKDNITLRRAIARLILGLTPWLTNDCDAKLTTSDKVELMRAKQWMGKLIHSDFDFDRADFLRRDSFHTLGLPSISDPVTLLTKLKIERTHYTSEITLLDVPIAESFLIFHELMYPAVYLNDENLIVEELLQRAMDRAFPSDMDMMQFWFSTDEKIVHDLEESKDPIVNRIISVINEKAFYQCTARTFSNLPPECVKNLKKLSVLKSELPGLERTIEEKARQKGIRLEEGDIVLGINIKKSPPEEVKVMTPSGPSVLANESKLVDTLNTPQYKASRSRLVVGIRPRLDLSTNRSIMEIAIDEIQNMKVDPFRVESLEEEQNKLERELIKHLGGGW